MDLSSAKNFVLQKLFSETGDTVSFQSLLVTNIGMEKIKAYDSSDLAQSVSGKDALDYLSNNSIANLYLLDRWCFYQGGKTMKINISGFGIGGFTGNKMLWFSYKDLSEVLAKYSLINSDKTKMSCLAFFSDRYFQSELVKIVEDWKDDDN